VEDLQVPTQTVEVEVLTDGGERLSGSLFVPQSRFATGKPEEVIEILNDERRFLPFRPDARARKTASDAAPRATPEIVLNKDHIVSVRVGRAARRRRKAAPPAAGAVTLWLTDGSRVSGEVAVETPWASSRLVDKVNQEQRFVPVISDEGLLFVQRTHVLRLG
jgi:hypothetical protein